MKRDVVMDILGPGSSSAKINKDAFGEMADYMVSLKVRKCSKNDGEMSKGHRDQLEAISPAKLGQFQHQNK